MRNYHKDLIKWHEKAITELTNSYREECKVVQSYYLTYIKDKSPEPKRLGKFNRMVKTAKATQLAIADRESDLEFLKSVPVNVFNRIYGWGYAAGGEEKYGA